MISELILAVYSPFQGAEAYDRRGFGKTGFAAISLKRMGLLGRSMEFWRGG